MEISINNLADEKREVDNFFTTRSVLYNLEPIGVGTPYVESLSSYISRLAIVHNVNVSSLLKGLLAPVLNKEYIKKELSMGITAGSNHYINENSSVTLEYVNALELLTNRSDLIHLTMLNWMGIFPKNIRSPYRKWCPSCLHQMKLQSKDEYEPLLWCLSDINKCDIHEVLLQDKCHTCNRNLPFLHSRYKVGYCQYCDSWLGQMGRDICKENLSKDDEFILMNYKQLIEKAPNLKSFPSKSNIPLLFTRLINELGFRNMTRFANFLGYSHATVSEWINRKYSPSHKTLISLGQKLNHTIYELIYIEDIIFNINSEKYKKRKNTPTKEIQYYLTEGINSAEPKSLFNIAREAKFSPDTAQRHFPLLCNKIQENYKSYKSKLKIQKQHEIEFMLNECLSREIPISLTQLLKENGIVARTARSYASNLCKKVSLRYIEYLSELKKKRIESITDIIQKTAIELHINGVFPSKDRIQRELGNSVFLEEVFRDRWEAIILSLGYKID